MVRRIIGIAAVVAGFLNGAAWAQRPAGAGAAGARGGGVIEGVQAAALDQPRIPIELRRKAGDQPLVADVGGEKTSEVEAFADTGASGLLLSKNTAEALGVRMTPGVVYADVGVAGSDEFGVSEPVIVTVGGRGAEVRGQRSGVRNANPGALMVRAEVGPLNGGLLGGLMGEILGNLDVAGMPVLAGKVLVIDPKPTNKFEDKLRCQLLAPGDRGIPLTARHVRLTPVSFRRFARVTPAGGVWPSLSENPMIGPSPFAAGDRTPGVIVTRGNVSAGGTFLLDTGAAASMISKKVAARLGVVYDAGGDKLVGVKDQFSLTVGGIGGQHKAAGFYLDSLSIPTVEGQPIVYRRAPVLVSDITVADAKTGEAFTLDGVFGMNYLVASASITEGLLPDIGNLTPGPFDVVVIDLNRGELGVR